MNFSFIREKSVPEKEDLDYIARFGELFSIWDEKNLVGFAGFIPVGDDSAFLHVFPCRIPGKNYLIKTCRAMLTLAEKRYAVLFCPIACDNHPFALALSECGAREYGSYSSPSGNKRLFIYRRKIF